MRFHNAEGMLAQWLEELSQYDTVIQHHPGKKHGNADGLSQIPDDTEFCNCYDPTGSNSFIFTHVFTKKHPCQRLAPPQWLSHPPPPPMGNLGSATD